MKRTTSLYLDLSRFLAALAVFAYHTGGQHITGGLLWRVDNGGVSAVAVFFVLSGYVIAHVLSTRENNFREFAAGRLARLYSVVLPALVITAICDYAGLLKNPEFYIRYAGVRPDDNVVFQYISTALFVNQTWLFPKLEPGSNGPFWSLSFEAVYYVAIAIIVFARGWLRAAGIIALCLWAGPAIVSLAPLWFLGYGIYHFGSRIQLSFYPTVALWIISFAGLIFSFRLLSVSFALPFIAWISPAAENAGTGLIQTGEFLCRYAAGICFAANIVALDALAERLDSFAQRFRQIIQWLGSLTFALYLFHRPLVTLLAVYNIGTPDSLAQRIWVLGGTMLVVVTIGRICEQSKSAYKRFFLKQMPRSGLRPV